MGVDAADRDNLILDDRDWMQGARYR